MSRLENKTIGSCDNLSVVFVNLADDVDDLCSRFVSSVHHVSSADFTRGPNIEELINNGPTTTVDFADE